MIKGKKIILGITGSIAAYKAALIVRLLVKAGVEVKVIMTNAAANFIAPLTLSTLSRNHVLSELSENETWANHVALGRWADMMLIAPLSCNTLAKMANGLCDNLLLAVYLSATCPVIVAPAMDEDMWIHQTTQQNINKLLSFGNHLIPVDIGELASGLSGPGRMAEPEEIIAWIENFFQGKQELSGKKVLITAGPTYEKIDPVRFIGNHSTGKMGIALAEECAARGAAVTLVLGPTAENIPAGMEIIRVTSASEMFDACLTIFPTTDIAIMCAAVADFSPVTSSTQKIKKSDANFTIELMQTPDILKTLGGLKNDKQFVVGFALETNNEKEHALQKLIKKNADLIILNSLQDQGAGFGKETNKISIFDREENEYKFETKLKSAVATDIVNTILKLYHV